MKYQELTILLPCHSLEDFPVHHEGEEAAGLLAGWSALWHPHLLATTGAAPTWHRVDDPPADLSERLVIIPSVSASDLPTGFAQRAKQEGALLIRRLSDRDEILARALEPLGEQPSIDPLLIADFLALGYCFLQIELLTRQMRYSSNLDETHFNNLAVGAAQAAVEGQTESARQQLTQCFDLLAEERDHYYSVDAFVLDVAMVTPRDLGQIGRELDRDVPVNLLISREAIESLAETHAADLQRLIAGWEAGTVGLLGGEYHEWRTPLLSVETVLANLRRGAAAYAAHLGRPPRIFGRRRFGLVPLLPQVLHKLGFNGALHATLEDGRFPEGSQVKTRWEGSDGTSIDAIARAPHNATRAETFLGFAGKLGESMDTDHVATLFLAHWAGQSGPWMSDLHRIANFNASLGRLISVDTFFRDTDLPGHMDRFEIDRYRSPYLQQAVVRRQVDPISTCVRYWQRTAKLMQLRGCRALWELLSQRESDGDLDDLASAVDDANEEEELSPTDLPGSDLPGSDTGGEVASETTGAGESLDERLDAALERVAGQLAEALPRDARQPPQPGYLLLNPCSFVRRLQVVQPALEKQPGVEKPVYYALQQGDELQMAVDVPAMGYAWVSSGGSGRSQRSDQPLAEPGLLRNEFLEAIVHPETGALRSVRDYEVRGNRVSQQLTARLSNSDELTTRMVAQSCEVLESSIVRGRIESRGKLVDQLGEPIADFVQQFEIRRGSRIIRMTLDLELHRELAADPWNSYLACRFAWAAEGAEITRAVNQQRHTVEARRFESPQYVEVDDGKGRIMIHTGGLPYHRRIGYRMLDSLLIVRGERQRRFELGLGLNVPQPQQAALGEFAPALVVSQTASPPAPAHSWLFHIDARSVIATHWESLIRDGKVVGFRARILETGGRPVRCKLSCFRDPSVARQRDFQGNSLADCKLEKNRIALELAGHEWLEIEAEW